jgi:hypothetical protein
MGRKATITPIVPHNIAAVGSSSDAAALMGEVPLLADVGREEER